MSWWSWLLFWLNGWVPLKLCQWQEWGLGDLKTAVCFSVNVVLSGQKESNGSQASTHLLKLLCNGQEQRFWCQANLSFSSQIFCFMWPWKSHMVSSDRLVMILQYITSYICNITKANHIVLIIFVWVDFITILPS